MRIRWLGWAGVEVEADGARVVADPLEDAAAVFAALGDRVAGMHVPEVAPPRPGAIAALVTHLHRDHTDAAALSAALADEAVVYEPEDYGGNGVERLAIIQADRELTAAGLTRRATRAWTSVEAGPFTLTALPAVDGTGDPQVSWLIEAGSRRVLHLGDTMFHGWWWRIAERFGAPDVVFAPINGARLTFPHRQPPSPLAGAMGPDEAALAGELVRAEQLVPFHYGGYEMAGLYEPVPDALERVKERSDRVKALQVGEAIEV